MKKILYQILGLLLFGLVVIGAYWSVTLIWDQFKLLDPKLSIGLLTAATTVLVATLTIVLGKYYERKMDIEAHYRVKKTEIYDEFLAAFFELFGSDNNKDRENVELIAFIREWQRKMILWGGQDVLTKYISWMQHLKNKASDPDAKTMFIMEEFFLAIRKDLGHKNTKLVKGTFIRLLLQSPDLFLTMASENPEVTLAEVAEAERATRG